MPRLRLRSRHFLRQRLSYRARLFAVLLLFAVTPSVLLTAVWAGTAWQALPLLSGAPAWERAGTTGARALAVARRGARTAADRAAVEAHAQELNASLGFARQLAYLAPRLVQLVIGGGVLLVVLLALVASRAAGHLSRQLSRPLQQLVRWTGFIQRGAAIPREPAPRGAPEFGVLRRRMTVMARELAEGRTRALEAERAEAFRETARRVAHELKNPLTPIRFGLDTLRRTATPAQHEVLEVLTAETTRLEAMARSFAQFGRLPDGPAADVDLGEMVRRAVATVVPAHVSARVEVAPETPLVRGHHDALQRALTNVLLNAIEACEARTGEQRTGEQRTGEPRSGEAPCDGDAAAAPTTPTAPDAIVVRVAPVRSPRIAGSAVELAVRDAGVGIAPERLAQIWDPYVTHKAQGTGLGLAIARQTVTAHGGAVDAASAIGCGTEIRFILPVAGPEPDAPIRSFTGEFSMPARQSA
ncbi:MAG TPA: HAMP domain-containing sensor histidine kinase [Gemmatirosa sp.]|nr:HAMP domain-containing sensor histidine kinase [Gemmatirosa sp.]